MCRILHVLAFFTLYLGLAHSWDFAVGVEDELRLYTNRTITSTIRFDNKKLAALTYYGDGNVIMFLSKQPNNDAFCSYSISLDRSICTSTGRNIHDITFDPVTRRIFFTDTDERTVNWYTVTDKPQSNPRGKPKARLLIKVTEGIPRDIVVDSCQGYVYWLNTNMTYPTIERVRLDGTGREVFANINSINYNGFDYQPHSLAIDLQTQTIYWVQPARISASKIHSLSLNKTNKRSFNYKFNVDYPSFIHPSNTLTISNKFLYSVEYSQSMGPSIYELSKTPDPFALFGDPGMTTSLGSLQTSPQIPVSIATNYKIVDQIQGRQDCQKLRHAMKIPTECEATFCVNGEKVNEKSVCKCFPGYIGERCDVSVCENYCLKGNCTVNDSGLPECRCDAGNTGMRCEINVCYAYCLNGGDCSLNEAGDPVCRCAGSYEGSRCEVETRKKNLFH